MGKLAIGLIAFGGGVVVGLLAAKMFARVQVEGGVHDLLSTFGLGGGKIEQVIKPLAGDLLV
jgi:hypothetical protein